jgi:hypothetical protein
VPPSHRSAFPDPIDDEGDGDEQSEQEQQGHQAPNNDTTSEEGPSDRQPRFDVSKADYWVTDERLQRQFLYNPVTGERRWVVPVFDSHWEPVAALLD